MPAKMIAFNHPFSDDDISKSHAAGNTKATTYNIKIEDIYEGGRINVHSKPEYSNCYNACFFTVLTSQKRSNNVVFTTCARRDSSCLVGTKTLTIHIFKRLQRELVNIFKWNRIK